MPKFPLRLFATVVGVLTASLFGAYLMRREDSASLWVPLGLSIGSLLVAVLSAFKNELFEFAPAVLASDIGLIHVDRKKKATTPEDDHPNGESDHRSAGPATPETEPMFVFPLWFINSGYAEGVVEGVAIKVTNVGNGSVFKLLPLFEIDPKLFAPHKDAVSFLNVDRILGTFAIFPLSSKQVISKVLVFFIHQKETDMTTLQAGKHRFEVYVKSTSSRKPKRLYRFDRELSNDTVDGYLRGKNVYIGAQDQDMFDVLAV